MWCNGLLMYEGTRTFKKYFIRSDVEETDNLIQKAPLCVSSEDTELTTCSFLYKKSCSQNSERQTIRCKSKICASIHLNIYTCISDLHYENKIFHCTTRSPFLKQDIPLYNKE